MKAHYSICLLALAVATIAPSKAQSSIEQAFTGGELDSLFRYRFEVVNQDGLDENARANTLLSRFTLKSGKVGNWSALVEFDYVTELLDKDYNNTVNGNAAYPVVADPSGADLNQAAMKYQNGKTQFTLGRQRINHNNQRFVGGVAWRQNEQTFDGGRVEYDLSQDLSVDYSYSYRVNRLFGSKHPLGDLDTNLHLLNVGYSPAKGHTLAAFAYHMDFDQLAALSNQTIGLDYQYQGAVNSVKLAFHLAYATQRDAADNPADYSASYYAIDGKATFAGVTAGLGYEVLGSDNGKGFATPLATLHKFQGFADKFLATPGAGIKDRYVSLSSVLSGVKLSATYHQFEADEGSIDYGDELDLVAAYKINSHYSFLAKFARYDAEALATDTNKLWLQLVARY